MDKRDGRRNSPGDSHELENREDQIVLRLAGGKARMYKKQGMWVLRGDTVLAPNVIENTVRKVRRERERAIFQTNTGKR
jgi:hypothetical protein